MPIRGEIGTLLAVSRHGLPSYAKCRQPFYHGNKPEDILSLANLWRVGRVLTLQHRAVLQRRRDNKGPRGSWELPAHPQASITQQQHLAMAVRVALWMEGELERLCLQSIKESQAWHALCTLTRKQLLESHQIRNRTSHQKADSKDGGKGRNCSVPMFLLKMCYTWGQSNSTSG